MGGGWTADDDVAVLVATDPRLAAVVTRAGRPPSFARPWSLRTIVLVVLEQQLSLEAAATHMAALERTLAGTPTAAGLASLTPSAARRAGVSRQKHRTLVALGAAVGDGRLDLDEVASLDDEAARTAITAVHGLGPWTADVLLLGALGRRDVWPVGDRALRVAAAEELGLAAVPDGAGLAGIGEGWRPRRSAAARVLWHGYLDRRGRTVPAPASD